MNDVSPDWVEARSLIRRYGWNASCYQILNPGFQLWFSADREAVVGYVGHHGVWVVGGAPVCAEERLVAVMDEFEAAAAVRGCGVVYFGAESRLAELAAGDARRVTFLVGAQPVWRARELCSWMQEHPSLRAQLHRARNKGLAVRVISPEEVAALEPQLLALLDQWLESRGLPPLHFLVETQTLTQLGDRRVWLAERDGVPVAYLVATPIPTRGGWLIEQMVRGRDSPNGTNELLLYRAAAELGGGCLITLGLAPLSRRAQVRHDPGPRRMRWLLASVRAYGRHFYDFEGLDAFKAKFRPTWWEPVYTSTAPGTPLARALLAITGAFGGMKLRDFAAHALAHEAQRLRRRLFF